MVSLHSWLSRLSESKTTRPLEDAAFASPALSRFAAMPKLVDQRELDELARKGGFDTQLLRKLRLERRRTYRLYLFELIAEFRSCEKEALYRAANDPGVDPGFAGEVLKIKARFMISVWMLRASLWLPASALPKTHQWTRDLVGAGKQFSKQS